MSIYRCRLCGSSNVEFNPNKTKRSRSKPKSRLFELSSDDEQFSIGNDEPYHCRACGHDDYNPMDNATRDKIDKLLLNPQKNKLEIANMRKIYPNIEGERSSKKSKEVMGEEKKNNVGKLKLDFLIGDGIERLELIMIDLLEKFDMLSIPEMSAKLEDMVINLQERYVLKAILNLVDFDIIKKRVDIDDERFSLVDKTKIEKYRAIVEKELKENAVATNKEEKAPTYTDENTGTLQSVLGGIFKNNDTMVIEKATQAARESLYYNAADQNNNGIDDSYEKSVYEKINELKRKKLQYQKILLSEKGKESRERAEAEERIKEIDKKIIELIDSLESL